MKLNPVIFGKGIPTFGSSTRAVNLKLSNTKRYDSGVVLLDYDILY